MDKILSSVPAASWTPLHHQVRNPGNKVTTTLPPCLANPLIMSWHLWETICHCMHVAISHRLSSQLAVDVPEHLDLPKLQGWFIVDCLHVSDEGRGFVSVRLDHDLVKARGSWTTYCLLDYCKDCNSLVSLCLHSELDNNTEKIVISFLCLSATSKHD